MPRTGSNKPQRVCDNCASVLRAASGRENKNERDDVVYDTYLPELSDQIPSDLVRFVLAVFAENLFHLLFLVLYSEIDTIFSQRSIEQQLKPFSNRMRLADSLCACRALLMAVLSSAAIVDQVDSAIFWSKLFVATINKL